MDFDFKLIKFSAAVKALFVFVVLCCAACSAMGSKEPMTRAQLARQRPITNSGSDVPVDPFVSSETEPLNKGSDSHLDYGVELTWEIPSEPVEGFILYVGRTPEVLNTEIHIAVSDLEVVLVTKYRYVIKPVESGVPLYVGLAAQYEGKLSPRSEVQRIDPELLPASPSFGNKRS